MKQHDFIDIFFRYKKNNYTYRSANVFLILWRYKQMRSI